jgi:hypothetical protein
MHFSHQNSGITIRCSLVFHSVLLRTLWFDFSTYFTPLIAKILQSNYLSIDYLPQFVSNFEIPSELYKYNLK